MPLDSYRAKREFTRTPEPEGGQSTWSGPLRFVIQKHAASHLHYDVRLEMDGVLRSWAVPKGPSLDTRDKRLAVEVEDHPIEYGEFEGTIPSGEYGAGTVMVWDFGTYEPHGDVREMYRAGSLKVELHGTKLAGGFALVRMKRRPGERTDNWLLIKERDEHARPRAGYDVLEALPRSARTGRTMAEIEAGAPPPAREVAGVRLTHPERIVFGEAGLSKLDLARYYERVAPHILPHLAGRPLSLVRCPEGVAGGCFFQKNMERGVPGSVRTVEVAHETGSVHYALVDSAEGLVALVQLGVVEIHTWGSRTDDLEHPDRMVFDLDPGEGVGWKAVTRAAMAVRGLLEALGMVAFLKTTGGTGLHVVTPLGAGPGWGEVHECARSIAERMAAADPARYTTDPRKVKRQGKVFIDHLRNTRGATTVAAFSARARPHAPVSVPVGWSELARGLRSDSYTLPSVPRRLAALRHDPWEGYGQYAADLGDVMRALGVGRTQPRP